MDMANRYCIDCQNKRTPTVGPADYFVDGCCPRCGGNQVFDDNEFICTYCDNVAGGEYGVKAGDECGEVGCNGVYEARAPRAVTWPTK